MTEIATIKLKKGKDSSLLRKHPWVFSGAIESATGEIEEGNMVDVLNSENEFIARGICATGSIAVRILTFTQEEIDQNWWTNRIREAYQLRQRLGLTNNPTTNSYRLIHGEGDNIPGLIVDIYASTAVIQAHAVGIYLHRDEIANAIVEVVGVKNVYDKSSTTIPFDSGVEPVDSYLIGAHSDDTIVENGIELLSAWEGGQKTGFFIDQRESRELLRHYCDGKRVLNTFCYTGGFSLSAMAGGATLVDSVDSSARAIELCTKNIEKNFADTTITHNEIIGDALEFIRNLDKDKYDVIVLDPPAFAKHRGALTNALQAYKRLNATAIKNSAPGSIIFTYSCSQAVSKEQFRMAVFSGAAIARRNVRILHFLSQPADHPINIYHPEGEYLKGLVLYVE